MLTARDVHFAYGGVPVLSGVTLDVTRGALVSILGPNGSGKTTLLRLMSGALSPGRGVVTLEDAPIGTRPRAVLARRIAVVAQDTHLAFDYTALEIVLMGRYPHLGAFEIEGPADLSLARAALETTGTADLADRLFDTLSGGEKQRVVIASALAQLSQPAGAGRATIDPDAVLLLDEPTASLDLRYQFEVAAVLRRLHGEGLTIVLSTHDLRLAAAVSTSIALLGRGRILGVGAPRDVLTAEAIGALYQIDAALAAPLVPA